MISRYIIEYYPNCWIVTFRILQNRKFSVHMDITIGHVYIIGERPPGRDFRRYYYGRHDGHGRGAYLGKCSNEDEWFWLNLRVFSSENKRKKKNVKLKIDFNSNQLRRHGSLIIDCSYTLPMLIHSPVHFFFTLIILGEKVTDYNMREQLIR